MIIRRTDLAVEARQLWMESAAETAELKGVAAGERQRDGFPVRTNFMADGTLNQEMPRAMPAAISVEPIPVENAPSAP